MLFLERPFDALFEELFRLLFCALFWLLL